VLGRRHPAVAVITVSGLLPLGVGARQDMMRPVVGVGDGAVLRVGGADQVRAAPGEGADLRAGRIY